MKHEPAPRPVNLADKLGQFDEHWRPHVVGSYNGNDLMVVKVRGEFVWHDHADTDDLFFVLKGRIRVETENGDVDLNEGELYVVPRGVRHRPVAEDEAHLLLIEPAGTPNTGDPATAAPKERI